MNIDLSKLSKRELKRLGRIQPHNVVVVRVNIKEEVK